MTFTVVGTVNANARLRGRIEHNWELEDKVLITDLELQQPVMEWDGTTLQNVAFVNEIPEAFGTFKAKYCSVSNERAMFANIDSNATDTPHLIVGSKRGDYTSISVAQRPSSALSAEDPFFLIQPDYKSVNGLVEFAKKVTTSSEFGSVFNLLGSDSTDFEFDELYPGSGASGVESVAYIGNDILYGRQGRIESLKSTDKFGDVETDDASLTISNLIDTFAGWTITYNSRLQRAYCIPQNQSQMWVLHKPLVGSQLSPWAKWTTTHSMAFNPTAIMNVIDPQDGLEYVFMGDADGNIYRMEGSGASGDGGTDSITASRLSKLFTAPQDQEYLGIDGWVSYRKDSAFTISMTFEQSGYSVLDNAITVDVPEIAGRTVYGGSNYYSGGAYYGASITGRLNREKLGVPGSTTDFQVRITVEGTNDFAIHDFGFKLQAA